MSMSFPFILYKYFNSFEFKSFSFFPSFYSPLPFDFALFSFLARRLLLLPFTLPTISADRLPFHFLHHPSIHAFTFIYFQMSLTVDALLQLLVSDVRRCSGAESSSPAAAAPWRLPVI